MTDLPEDSVVYVDLEDVLMIADRVTGDVRTMVRDIGLLQSAVYRPQTRAFGVVVYPGVFEKAAALLQSLSRNHPFIDGNKPTAWLACMMFLAFNGVQLRVDTDYCENLVVDVATGAVVEIPAIAKALEYLAVR
ncbi:type II toxin-antitoxin system death-on-curing family toxin [Nocardia kruczakiae]|uniref:type II toxin-antitoxin system death-on-curing family toxin n=1 Tax=Nocardia kruczakiae TaxID=261477 RepID=UPI000A5B89EA|nr:type II toxin-antitoxin system death-on-curing family toxin [Nocardia kruczakiae]